MGAITRAAANNITTGGVILPAAINDASVASITALAQVSAGDGITLISSQTASSSASLSFTTGIDSTYRTYLFKFINMHPATDNVAFQVNFRDGSSAFDATKTTTMFFARHREDDGESSLAYSSGEDLAQSTNYQNLYFDTGNGNDESGSGEMFLFSPSSTTFVKHFIAKASSYGETPREYNTFCAGYCNVTSAIDGVDFKFSSGNIDAGTILMYGIA
jgi:hypothetical protein